MPQVRSFPAQSLSRSVTWILRLPGCSSENSAEGVDLASQAALQPCALGRQRLSLVRPPERQLRRGPPAPHLAGERLFYFCISLVVRLKQLLFSSVSPFRTLECWGNSFGQINRLSANHWWGMDPSHLLMDGWFGTAVVLTLGVGGLVLWALRTALSARKSPASLRALGPLEIDPFF